MTNETLKLLANVTVLVAEDDEVAREVLCDGLKSYCKAVYTAADGFEGLEKFNKFNADIILTDIHMPTMNGFDMMKEILKIKPHQNFIVFTSYDTDDNLLKSIKHGAALFLKKPIDIQELRTALIMLTSKNEDKFTSIGEGVRGKDVFVIQSTCAPANVNLMELLILTDALRRSSASSITSIVPYFGYARQDRKAAPRVPITAKLVANMMQVAGIDRVVTIDLHAGQI